MYVAIIIFLATVLFAVAMKRRKGLAPPLGSGTIPLFGHAFKVLTDPEGLFRLVMQYSMESIQRNVPITIRILTTGFYFVTHPEDANIVLNSSLKKDIIYDYFKPWLGEGLISASETTWRKHRKLLNPTFNQAVLNGYLSELNKQAKSLVSRLQHNVGKGKFNPIPDLEHVTLQSISSTAMGVIIDDDDFELREQYLRAKSKFSKGLVTRAQSFWLHSDILYHLSNLKRTQTNLANILHKLTNTIIQKRKKDLPRIEFSAEKRLKPFMEHLLDMEKEGILSEKEVQEEIDSFTLAGSDTISVTLTNLLLNVGSYPQVQRLIFKELQEVFQGSLRDVEKQDLTQLKYLDAVVKESLRLIPTVPIVGRTLNRNIMIRNHTLPSGSRCFVSLYGVNRHPSWGPDVDQFRPERWLDSASLPAQQFASFGFGRRRCIGSTFAVMSAKTMMAHVLRHYRVSGDVTELVQTMEVVARPVPKDYISIEHRK